jgi:hypothetical protein
MTDIPGMPTMRQLQFLRPPAPRIAALAIGFALVATPASVMAASKPAPVATAPAPTPGIDPTAMKTLVAMGAQMKTVKAFDMTAQVSLDEAVDDIKITSTSTTHYVSTEPHHFFIEEMSEWKDRQYIYDGSTFTLVLPRQKYYATVAAPPTITELNDMLFDKYKIEIPLSDMFTWVARGAPTSKIERAIYVGRAIVDGVDTDQFIYRNATMDMQLWITRDGKPMPRKVVLTERNNPAKPSYSAVLTWNLSPPASDDKYSFKPPADFNRIAVAPVPAGEAK